ncbi:MAG: glycine--tRNA ligase subunit beta, partial [Desulfobulbales bacterium]
MQNELLLEIGSEEIPAGFIKPALENMQKAMAENLAEYDLQYKAIQTAATPRRLVICVRGLVSQQPDRKEEFLGPAKSAAFDAENNPTKAAAGFARSKGAKIEDLKIIDTPKGEYVMIIRHTKGEKTENLLPKILHNLIEKISFPKSMRWGMGHTSFARPIHWLLALYEGSRVELQIGDIASDTTTRGHRFMSPMTLEIQDFEHYIETLRQHHVLVDI